jgi:thioredoxin reductase
LYGNIFLIQKLVCHKRFRFLGGFHVAKLRGQEYLEEIDVVELSSMVSKPLKVAAVFVYRGIVPNIEIVAVKKDAKGFLLVDENYMTSLPGVFATGRVVYADLPIQVLVGDGSRTGFAVAAWLQAGSE